MELIDTHCHLTFEQLSDDIEAVLARSVLEDVTGWITVGTDPQQNLKAVELAGKFENMYAAVGIHPHEAKDVTAETLTELKELAQGEKVVALGETGLDFHYNFSSKSDQKRAFAAQLKIAKELNLPAIIHCREAFDETMEILDQYGRDLRGVVFHCFSGSAEQAKIILDYGFYISFTGVVTFKNADIIRNTAKLIPTDKLMLETDCPYMSPEPMRKQKINEPALMIHTARYLAELKQMDLTDFANAVTAASKSFFDLP
ncbi:MAG: TatD family hydrolase [Planctomycetes bacterium]|nr:TatD family hydrolase [Planctomycetota bacterium]MBL7143966.1 TatD family hydrolase [Phycisphaerae bacterium]